MLLCYCLDFIDLCSQIRILAIAKSQFNLEKQNLNIVSLIFRTQTQDIFLFIVLAERKITAK